MKPATMFVLRRLGPMVALLALALVSSAHPVGAQEPGNRAGLIIEYGPDRVDTLCVTFAEDSLTGSDLLLKSGLSVGMQSGLGVPTQMRTSAVSLGASPAGASASQSLRLLTYFQWKDGVWAYALLIPAAPSATAMDAWSGRRQVRTGHRPGLVCAEAPPAPGCRHRSHCRPYGHAHRPACASEAPEGTRPASALLALILLPLALLGALALWRR